VKEFKFDVRILFDVDIDYNLFTHLDISP